MSTLSIRYEPEDAHHGNVVAQAQSGNFAGHGSAWFTRPELTKFADELASYPLRWETAVILQGGYWGKRAGDALTQTHLRIAIRPHDRTGSIRVSVLFSDPYEEKQEDELAQSAKLFFLTTYDEIGAFRQELVALINGDIGVAQLHGV